MAMIKMIAKIIQKGFILKFHMGQKPYITLTTSLQGVERNHSTSAISFNAFMDTSCESRHTIDGR